MEAPVRRVNQMEYKSIIRGSGKPRIKRDVELDGRELVLDPTECHCSIQVVELPSGGKSVGYCCCSFSLSIA